MLYIAMEPLENGAYDNYSTNSTFAPREGYAIVPDSIDIPSTFPYVNIETELSDEGYYIVTSITEGLVPPKDINKLRKPKERRISSSCNSAIISGIDVETSQGIEHFSLEETDQINLTTALSAIQQGATSYPYHADGQLCRIFSAEEIQAVADASVQHKLYHTTLCNHLLTWVRRAETEDEINSITYSAENLPEDLAENMNSILTTANSI